MENFIEQRALGSQGLKVSCQGLGLMGMTSSYFINGEEVLSDEEKINTIGKALELGINFFDTAWAYKNFQTGETNEALLGKALKKYGREKFIVGTKFGLEVKKDGDKIVRVFNGKPEGIRSQLADSLERLETNYVDLYTMHRVDPNTPIEETMKCLLELQKEGKVLYVGLCECTPEELERAHKVMPVTAVQLEWSLNTRDVEKELIPMCRKLGIGIVAYSPLGRGLLTTTITKKDDLSDNDWRKTNPRFNDENLQKNLDRTKKLEEFAKKKGFSSAQLALAWVHLRGKDVFPIPGTKSSTRLVENLNALKINLDEKECKEIEELVGESYGNRYCEFMMKHTHDSR